MPLVMLRDRETIIERTILSGAHELGHLVLHPQLFTTDDQQADHERDYEKEAHYFAGCLLVPTDDLVYVWEKEGLHRLAPVYALLLLKRVFRVSFWCPRQRVEQAGLTQIDYPRLVTDVKRLLNIRGRANMAALEPEPLPPAMLQRSTRFERLVYSAFMQDKIGIAKVAEVFQITVDEASITPLFCPSSHVFGRINYGRRSPARMQPRATYLDMPSVSELTRILTTVKLSKALAEVDTFIYATAVHHRRTVITGNKRLAQALAHE
jgi:Zn-dependent peptidase ImmA (M78 family)